MFQRSDWLLQVAASEPAELDRLLGMLDTVNVVLRLRFPACTMAVGLAGAAQVLDSEPSLARCCWFAWPSAGVA